MIPFAIVGLICLGLGVPSDAKDGRAGTRGYLDKDYAIDSLNGRTLLVHGISKRNAKLEKSLEVVSYDEDALAMDSLYAIFNARLAQSLKQKLGKAQVVQADPVPAAGGTRLSKLIGDPAMPDSFGIDIPSPAPGNAGSVSLVVGKAVFGVRSQQKVHYRSPHPSSPDHPFPHGTKFPKLPTVPRFKQRFYLEDSDPLEPKEPENPWEVKVKQRRFYTIVEFCFYDHRTKRAFGYGWDGVETDFQGEFAKFFLGQKVSLDRHMRRQADNLAGLFVRKGSQVENYRNTEISIFKRTPPPPEIIREELEADEEE